MCTSLSPPQIELCAPAANWCSHPGGVGPETLSSLAHDHVHHGVRVVVDSCVRANVYRMIITDSCMCIERQFVWGITAACGLRTGAVGISMPGSRHGNVGYGFEHDLQAAIRPQMPRHTPHAPFRWRCQ